jgi:hypothetical protein
MATPLPAPYASSSSWDDSLARATPEYQRWLGQTPRPPRVIAALALAFAATAVPLLGPVCWAFTERELQAIENRRASRRGERAIELARSWGIGATFLAVAAVGFVASFLACRL